MTWLRIDDGFAMHPKVIQLSRADRWTWVEVLCFCARYKTDGEIPLAISEAVPKATRQFLHRCVDIGLLDLTDEPAMHIHDWKDYNPSDPTNATRQMRHRNKRRNGEVTHDVTDEVTEKNVTDVTPRARGIPSRPLTATNQPTEANYEPVGSVFQIDTDHILRAVDA